MKHRLSALCVLLSLPLFVGCASQAGNTQYARSTPSTPAHGTTTHPAATIASRMLGTPYRFGGATPNGFDCSGLVYYAYHRAGYKVPRTSQQQYRDSLPVKKSHIREGDLLFFRIAGKVSHVGVYLGENRFIHAPSSGKRVSIASLDEPYWRQRLTKTGRFF
jgi:cell wall-associated NlpC family hydrolase